MALNSINSHNHLAIQANGQSRPQAFQQDFASLGSALSGGNLSAAQSSFSSLQQLTPSNGSSSSQSTSGSSSQNPFQTAMTALQQALGSGNLSAAQTAYSQLQTAIKSAPHVGHQHTGGEKVQSLSQPTVGDHDGDNDAGSTFQVSA